MKFPIPLLILLDVFVTNVNAAESCTPQPDCWNKNLTCEWRRSCNGEMCTSVCASLQLLSTSTLWLLQSLQFQRRLQLDTAINQALFLGTHNSFISPPNQIGVEENFTAAVLADAGIPRHDVIIGNQRLGLTDQLLLGIRHLELDIHYLPGVTGEAIRVCHWDLPPPMFPLLVRHAYRSRHKGARLSWQWTHIGCHKESVLFRTVLEELDAWLRKNPGEFVRVYLDNRVPNWRAAWALKDLTDVFQANRIFTPLKFRTQFQSRWPTVRELLSHGYQVMIENNDTWKWRKVPGVNETIWLREQLWSEFYVNDFRPFPACSIRNQTIQDGSKAVRALDASLALGPFQLFDTRKNGFHAGHVRQMTDCGVHVVSFDQVTPSFLQHAVWTWDISQPNLRYGCVALNVSSGRWRTLDCATKLPFACRRNAPDSDVLLFQQVEGLPRQTDAPEFLVTADKSVFNASRCPNGYSFMVPTNGYINSVIRSLAFEAGHKDVWLRHQTFFEPPV